ncbi:MAG: hypothetical protein WDN26_12625 [Chitinophagaceae bacterium]
MKKEKWIDEILQSAKGIRPMEANPYLHTRIEAKLQQDAPVQKIPLRWVYVTSVALLVLLFLNVSLWRTTTNAGQADDQQLTQEDSWTINKNYSLNY